MLTRDVIEQLTDRVLVAVVVAGAAGRRLGRREPREPIAQQRLRPGPGEEACEVRGILTALKGARGPALIPLAHRGDHGRLLR